MPEGIQMQPEPPRKGSRTARRVELAVVTGVLLLILVPATWTMVGAKRRACRNCLSSFGFAMHLYADENENWFPTSLPPLYPQYSDNLRVFRCPADPRYNEALPPESMDQWTSFVYLPGRGSWCPGPFHLAYDKPDNHWGGVNALRVDCVTEWWPASRAAEFLRRVELENEAVARWRASGKPAEAFGEFISPELRDLMKRPEPKLQHGKATW
jgi:hypothetical protein